MTVLQNLENLLGECIKATTANLNKSSREEYKLDSKRTYKSPLAILAAVESHNITPTPLMDFRTFFIVLEAKLLR